jgi:hypothetical protein
MIEQVRKAFNEGALLQAFHPCPEDLLDTVAGSMGHNTPEQLALEAKEQANIEKYGYKNWYDWKVANWGTKWDIGADGFEAQDDDDGLILTFESAWSPPCGAYETLVDKFGFSIRAYYYEPGMCYVGKWEDGVDECLEYGGTTSETVREVIGEELDDMFGISEEMAQYEAEENE